MHRHELLYTRVSGLTLLGVLLLTSSGIGQEATGRATLQQGVTRERLQQPLTAQQAQGTADQQQPQVEMRIPEDLERLLVAWEEKSSGVERLRGTFMRYVYDSVFNFEKRAHGRFWYQAPDEGRMDFQTVELPDPPINPGKIGSNGEPFRIEAEESQQWICTGQEIFIIHKDLEIYDYIQIPPHQQGRNISNGPLPFLFGMRADDAKERYHMNLGEQNWPEGRVVAGEDGQPVRMRPQVHVVAYPKLEQDQREWRRAEVLLDGVTFLPRAIRLLDPTMNKETVYVFDLSQMKLNETIWFPNPFNERPPRHYSIGFDGRAGAEQMNDSGIVPTGGRTAQP